MGSKRHLAVAVILLVMLLCASCFENANISKGQSRLKKEQQLIDMSIEELMEVPVVRVLKNGSQRFTDITIEQMTEASATRTLTGKSQLTKESPSVVTINLDSLGRTVRRQEQILV